MGTSPRDKPPVPPSTLHTSSCVFDVPCSRASCIRCFAFLRSPVTLLRFPSLCCILVPQGMMFVVAFSSSLDVAAIEIGENGNGNGNCNGMLATSYYSAVFVPGTYRPIAEGWCGCACDRLCRSTWSFSSPQHRNEKSLSAVSRGHAPANRRSGSADAMYAKAGASKLVHVWPRFGAVICM